MEIAQVFNSPTISYSFKVTTCSRVDHALISHTHLPLTVMLSPKKVHTPSDMEREHTRVTTDVKPRPSLERTRSIFPEWVERSNSKNTQKRNNTILYQRHLIRTVLSIFA